MAKTGNKFIDDHIMIVRPMTVKEVKKASEKPRIYVTRIKSGWTEGYVRYKSKDYGFSMKNFIDPSEYGIDNGCISKLFIIDGKDRGKDLVIYDRGWDKRPDRKNTNLMVVYRALLTKFNKSMPKEYQERWWSS